MYPHCAALCWLLLVLLLSAGSVSFVRVQQKISKAAGKVENLKTGVGICFSAGMVSVNESLNESWVVTDPAALDSLFRL